MRFHHVYSVAMIDDQKENYSMNPEISDKCHSSDHMMHQLHTLLPKNDKCIVNSALNFSISPVPCVGVQSDGRARLTSRARVSVTGLLYYEPGHRPCNTNTHIESIKCEN